LEKLAQKDQYIILVGDLNINTQQGVGSSHKQLLDVTKAYNLTSNKYTHTVTEGMATTTDQIIINMPATAYFQTIMHNV
jgi:hypothetical protein